jgi:polar amino acid transport system substrate-binding protein
MEEVKMRLSKLLLLPIALGAIAFYGESGLAQTTSKPMIDQVKERGVLRAGIRNKVPYLGFIDEKGNNAGFEIDLAREIAKRLGVKVEFLSVTSSTRIPMLEQGRIDLILATLTHYRKRDEVIDFSIAYFYSPQTLLVKKDSGIKSVADMAGKRIGASLGSGTVKNFPKAQPQAKVQTFQGWSEAFLALQQGLVDAVGTDVVILASLRAGSPQADKYELLGKEGVYGGGYYGIGLRPNDSKSRDAINFTLQDIWADGTWQKLFDKWLGKDSDLKMTSEQIGNFEMRYWNP